MVTVEVINGTVPSDPVHVLIPSGSPEQPTPPTVLPIAPGDNHIAVGIPLVGDAIVVTLPDGSTTTVTNQNGTWVTGGGAEVPVHNGYLLIPVNPNTLVNGGKVSVVVKNGDLSSTPTVVTVGANTGSGRKGLPKVSDAAVSVIEIVAASAATLLDGVATSLRKRSKK